MTRLVQSVYMVSVEHSEPYLPVFSARDAAFAAVAAYTLILAFILFFVLKKTIGLRVTEKEEIDGLDMHEHGCSAYANFHFHNDK